MYIRLDINIELQNKTYQDQDLAEIQSFLVKCGFFAKASVRLQ